MPTAAVAKFRAAVAKDAGLQKALKVAMGKGPEAVTQLAAERGFAFTLAEGEAALAETELSDLELELVSGGGVIDCSGNSVVT